MDLILFGILNKRIREVAQNTGSGVIITDESLTKSGQAADAKAVGDRLADLTKALSNKVDVIEGKGLSTNDFTDEYKNLLDNFPLAPGDEIIQVISINGIPLAMTEEGVVDIPVASEDVLGVVKSTSEENGVSVSEDGTMQVNSLSFSKIVQSEDEVLVLNGGSSDC